MISYLVKLTCTKRLDTRGSPANFITLCLLSYTREEKLRRKLHFTVGGLMKFLLFDHLARSEGDVRALEVGREQSNRIFTAMEAAMNEATLTSTTFGDLLDEGYSVDFAQSLFANWSYGSLFACLCLCYTPLNKGIACAFTNLVYKDI